MIGNCFGRAAPRPAMPKETETPKEGDLRVEYRSSQGILQVISWLVQEYTDGRWKNLSNHYQKDQADRELNRLKATR